MNTSTTQSPMPVPNLNAAPAAASTLLTDAGRRMVHDWNATQAAYPRDRLATIAQRPDTSLVLGNDHD